MFPVISLPGHVGLFISVVGKNKIWLAVSSAKEKVSWRECRAADLLLYKLYKSVGKFIFLDFLKVNQSGPLGSMQFVERIGRPSSPRESALFTSYQVRS